MIHDYALFLDIWVVVPVLIALGFGLWKLGKIVWAALSH